MGVLDQVMQLKGQGMSEQDIVNNLQQQGVSPKQITDAINQAKVKSAVTSGEYEGAPQANSNASSEYYQPQTQDLGGQYTPQQEEYYQEQPQAQGGYGMDSETIIELANQVFSEKIKSSEKKLSEISEFKTIMEARVESMDDRLKRMEKMFDTLQIKILEKVGSYSSGLEKTKKEVSMIEDSVEKMAKAVGTKHKSSSSKRRTTKKRKK